MATLNVFRNDSLLDNRQFRRNDSENSIHEICLKNAYITSSLLISCFIGLCAISHSLEINQLSAVNLFILASGVYFTLQDFCQEGKEGGIDYFEGFKVGLYTSLVAVGIHTLFIAVYTSLDTSILRQISDGTFWSNNTNPLTAAGITLFEGLAGSLIITYCFMQYFKKY